MHNEALFFHQFKTAWLGGVKEDLNNFPLCDTSVYSAPTCIDLSSVRLDLEKNLPMNEQQSMKTIKSRHSEKGWTAANL